MAIQNVTVLGIGIMGGGMADNLLKAGFKVTVYNRTRAKAEPFASKGARVASTPRQAAEGADLIFGMVGDDPASRGVWLGADGALAGAKSGAILVECSTLSPDWVKELSKAASDKGLSFLEAPVTGSKQAAATGNLRLFIGGDEDVIEKARPALKAISSDMVHLGPVGAGATWKLINNMMGAVHVAALSEAVVMAEKAGLKMPMISPLVATGPISSPIVKMKMERIAADKYDETDFSVQWMTKDVRYFIEMAKKHGVKFTTAEAALGIFQRAEAKGLGEDDIAAIIKAVRD